MYLRQQRENSDRSLICLTLTRRGDVTSGNNFILSDKGKDKVKVVYGL